MHISVKRHTIKGVRLTAECKLVGALVVRCGAKIKSDD